MYIYIYTEALCNVCVFGLTNKQSSSSKKETIQPRVRGGCSVGTSRVRCAGEGWTCWLLWAITQSPMQLHTAFCGMFEVYMMLKLFFGHGTMHDHTVAN